MMKNYRTILTILLIGITIFSFFKYMLSLKEKNDLVNSLNQAKEQFTSLENEKQNLLQIQEKLSQENSELKDNLNASEEKLAELNEDFQAVQGTIEQLNLQISRLKAENSNLQDAEANLKLELSRVSEEKESLKVRLSSLSELKKAIKELKRQMRQAWVLKKKTGNREVLEGNQGFLVKNGRSTYPAKIKIEVRPLPLNEK